ncbi:MAG: outer membrane protein assembly factor BamA [Nitrospirae bacterium]|nr:outer membrane protein assembly factor BamA [Nitrospirota bacterium]
MILLLFYPLVEAIGFETDSSVPIVTSISIQNPQGKSYKRLIKDLPISVGSRFSTKVVKKSMERLYETGLFSNVIVATDKGSSGISIKLIVLDKLRIGGFVWKGNEYFFRERLEEVSRLKVEDELVQGWEKDLEQTLIRFYHREGFFNAKIDVGSRPMGKPSRLQVEIKIQEGIQSTIGNIYFSGNPGFDQERLLEVLRIHPGFYYSRETIQNDIENLKPFYYRARYLKVKIRDFAVHTQGDDRVAIEIPVEAGPRIFTFISFKGPRHYLKTTLVRQLLIDEEKSIDDATIEESKKRLSEFYQNEGYPFVEITVERREENNGKIVNVYFHIAEGPAVLLTRLVFKGNASISDDILKNVIGHQKTGFWIPRYLQLPALQNDLESLLKVYRSHGFLSAKINKSLHYSPDQATVALEFEISEGVQTLVQSVTLEEISQTFLPDILKKIQIRENSPYNEAVILEDKIAIASYYHKLGYPDVNIEATAAFSKTTDRVDVKYKVDEGNQIKIGKILATGNERTRTGVILRELYFHSGDLYQEELLLKSQRKISQLGYFQFVNIRPKDAEEDQVVRDVEVNVKERDAGAFEFGAGYADVERFKGFAEISHKNIGGTGRRASLGAEVSQIGDKETANYTEPWIFDFPLDARASIYHESIQKLPASYTQTTVGGSVGVEKSFWDYYKFSLQYQNDIFHFINVPINAVLTQEDKDRVNIASLNPSLFRDTRDDFLNPKTGSFNAIWFRWAANFLASEIQEVKLTLQSSWYFPLTPNLIMGISSRGGVAYNFGETPDVPISERFKLGGRSTVRGYAEDTLGTLGQTINPSMINPLVFTPTGGNSMLVFNWEFRFNLPKNLGLVFFFDSGNVWRYHNSIWSSPLKSSVGPGLRYNTPIGPIRFDVGYKLNREEWESASEFHFTLGHAF